MPADTMTDVNGNLVRIVVDENCDSPRENENVGKMFCWHKKYILGDTHNLTVDEFKETYLNDEEVICLPVFMIDHSGIALNTTGFSCPWDSGLVGWIVATKDDIIAGWGSYSPETIEKAKECLKIEVEVYSDYLAGDCYGFQKVDKDGEVIDSCYGFIGSDHKASGLYDAANIRA